MQLVDLSMVEQRYDAVREVLEGATVKDTAIRYGVDRRTLHRWLVRYATDGLAALADKSSKPDRCPHQMAPEIDARIVEMRKSHPGWGPRTILNKLRRELDRATVARGDLSLSRPTPAGPTQTPPTLARRLQTLRFDHSRLRVSDFVVRDEDEVV